VRLGFGVIGAGVVGPVLAAAWAGVRHQLVGMYASNPESHDSVQAIVPEARLVSLVQSVKSSALVALASPADEIASLVADIAAQGYWQPGQLVLHTAAELGTDVLRPAVESGAIPLAIHPALTMSGTRVDLARLAEARCAVTAPAPVLPIAQAL